MRKQLSLRVTAEASARLEERAREAERLAGVPVPPAALAAALLHGALGLRPDGSAPSVDEAPAKPAAPPAEPKDEHDQEETPDVLRLRALAYARSAFVTPPADADRAVIDTWTDELAAHFPDLGPDAVRGILVEIGVPQEVLDAPRESGKPTPAAVIATIRETLRRKSPGERERMIAGWVNTVMGQTGCTEDEARYALEKDHRRFYALSGEMLGTRASGNGGRRRRRK